MVIYGVALLAVCMLVGVLLGELLGELIGVQANVGGVGIAMLLLILPFWVSFIIRTYSWIHVLGKQGFVNTVLTSLGIIDEVVAEPASGAHRKPKVAADALGLTTPEAGTCSTGEPPTAGGFLNVVTLTPLAAQVIHLLLADLHPEGLAEGLREAGRLADVLHERAVVLAGGLVDADLAAVSGAWALIGWFDCLYVGSRTVWLDDL